MPKESKYELGSLMNSTVNFFQYKSHFNLLNLVAAGQILFRLFRQVLRNKLFCRKSICYFLNHYIFIMHLDCSGVINILPLKVYYSFVNFLTNFRKCLNCFKMFYYHITIRFNLTCINYFPIYP